MTILVPVDFSENSGNAIEYAAEIARTMTGKIIALHVMDVGDGDDDTDVTIRKKLKSICQTVQAEYPEVHCSAEVAYGNIVDEIVALAELRVADLIVMGTEGVTSLGKLVFGSNTSLVIEKTDCTVLSIPSQSRFKKPETILFATSFSRDDFHAATNCVEFARAYDSTVIIAHVLTQEAREEVEESMIDIFSNELKQKTSYEKIQRMLADENTVSMGLDALLHESNADMIAFSTRRRGAFEKFYNPSLTQKFAKHSVIPILAFHQQNNN